MLQSIPAAPLFSRFEILYEEMEQDLARIWGHSEARSSQIRDSLELCRVTLGSFGLLIPASGFWDAGEEVYFFKVIKPRFYGRFLYYLELQWIENCRPGGEFGIQREYLVKELERLREFYRKNAGFYAYYLSGASHLDSRYFLKGKPTVYPQGGESGVLANTEEEHSADNLASRILAHEWLERYLLESIQELQGQDGIRMPNGKCLPTLRWTASKISLIELLYALQAAGVFNQGTADIKQTARFFEQIFQVDLGNYYRNFQDIRIRKSGRTHFLDLLRDILVQRLDLADDLFSHGQTPGMTLLK